MSIAKNYERFVGVGTEYLAVRLPGKPAGEKNCGAGVAGSQGFQPGNSCARGGSENLDRQAARSRTMKEARELEKTANPVRDDVAEINMAGTYATATYKTINSQLRRGIALNKVSGNMPEEVMADGREKPFVGVTALQSAAQRSLKTPLIVYRGVDDEIADVIKASDTFEAKGFVSTTANMEKALSFNRSILEIEIKSGLSLESVSEHDEAEIVQAHGTRYRYLGTAETILNGVPLTLLQLEEL